MEVGGWLAGPNIHRIVVGFRGKETAERLSRHMLGLVKRGILI